MRITEKEAAYQEALCRIADCKARKDTCLDLSDLTSLAKLPPEVCGLSHLEALNASGTELETLPRNIGRLKNLRALDVSFTRVTKIPASIVKCRSLSINRRFFTLTRLVSAALSCLSRLAVFGGVIRFTQTKLYWRFYKKLGEQQSELDVCGWHKDEVSGKPVCRRHWKQCCRYDYVCDYLTECGCSVESLCCRVWLCGPALDYLRSITARSAGGGGLCKKARRYLKARERYETICRMLCIPLKGRASLEDAFNTNFTPPDGINTYTERWYDDTLLAPWGFFISAKK